jgi:hypothetical protein
MFVVAVYLQEVAVFLLNKPEAVVVKQGDVCLSVTASLFVGLSVTL